MSMPGEKMMDAKMMQCDCGFMVQSHNENEIVQMAQMHVKDMHQSDLSARDARAMMKPAMMMR
jgi:predicted small metal-binding protein